MANNYFKFKQFVIWQNNVAMKVGTDGVLIGSWVDVSKSRRILDIGTGTGLLALMLAQRTTNSIIDAVEIDVEACEQAQQNVQNSNWFNRIGIYNQSFQDFLHSTTEVYDTIISNPPYFINSLQSPKLNRTLARHANTLSFLDLIFGVKKLLTSKGNFSLILPIVEGEKFISMALENNLYCSRRLNVKPTENKAIIRVLLEFIRTPTQTDVKTICIEKDKRYSYNEEFIELTKDFYLKF